MSQLDKPSFVDAAARAALGSIPVVGAALAELYSYGRALDEARVRQIGEVAREAVDDDEFFIRRLAENERLVDMLQLAVEGGRRSAWEAKRIAMGRVLGHAISDDAEIDEDAALLTALGALNNAVHFHWLGKLKNFYSRLHAGHLQVPQPYASALVAVGAVTFGPTVAGPSGGGFYYGTTGPTEFGLRLIDWVGESAETEEVPKEPE
ncbi:MAG: hypothetical protein ACRDYY_17880 [Acidimicrobiales bacterium]